jgi:uncharacterized UBP type Zn finger protein
MSGEAWWLRSYASDTARKISNLGTVCGELAGRAPSLCAANYNVDLVGEGARSRLTYFGKANARHGIPNLHNTCFVSALMQVVLRIEPLMQLLRAHASAHMHRDATDPSAPCTCTAVWCSVLLQARALRGENILLCNPSPVAMLVRRGFFGEQYRAPLRTNGIIDLVAPDVSSGAGSICLERGRQCDVAEFFTSFIDVLERSEVRTLQRMDPTYDIVYGLRTAIREAVFGGVARSRIFCSSCGAVSDHLTSCTSVVLSVPRGRNDSSYTLRELWEDHFQETLADRNGVCPRHGIGCASRARKQMFLEKEPPFLMIQLSRGWETWERRDNQMVRSARGKNCARVYFPPSLDFMRSGRYDFKGVVRHIGTTPDCGHYVATCSVGETRRGVEGYGTFNDNARVVIGDWSALTSDNVQREAYMLLYARCESVSSIARDGSEEVPYMRADS